jgi:hypothetical protein
VAFLCLEYLSSEMGAKSRLLPERLRLLATTFAFSRSRPIVNPTDNLHLRALAALRLRAKGYTSLDRPN